MPPSSLAVDASVAVWTVLPVVAPIDVSRVFSRWRSEGSRILAPDLWRAECTSAIRRAVFEDIITPDEGHRALQDVFALEVEIIPATLDLCLQAFGWADRLHQAKAYDGFYLATAAAAKASLVTADQRLSRAAKQLGVAWVTWVGDLA